MISKNVELDLQSLLLQCPFLAFNWTCWHSTNTKIQSTYKKHLKDIKSRYVNEFEANKK